MKRELVACRRRCGRAVQATVMRTCDACWSDLSLTLRKGIRRAQVWLEHHPRDPVATRVLDALLVEAEREWSRLPLPLPEPRLTMSPSPNLDYPDGC